MNHQRIPGNLYHVHFYHTAKNVQLQVFKKTVKTVKIQLQQVYGRF